MNFPTSSAATSFVTIEGMMRARDENRGTNKSNNSTYISKNEDGEYEAYCKTYGASKYESSLICYAMSMIIGHAEKIKLYEILEGNLDEMFYGTDIVKLPDTVKAVNAKSAKSFAKNVTTLVSTAKSMRIFEKCPQLFDITSAFEGCTGLTSVGDFIGASDTRALAIATLCCCPPDNFITFLFI